MAYAIVETGGKQIKVEPGRFYDVNRLAFGEEEQITLDRVLFVSDGDESHVGQPTIEGATITATVMRHLRGRKVIVYKMRPKKKTRKKQGHRQELTRLMVNAINFNGKAISEDANASSAKAAPATEAAPVAAVDAAAES